jgi:hypothetical protein
VSAGGLGLLAICELARRLGGTAVARSLRVASVAVTLLAPIHAAWQWTRFAPSGVLALLGSLVLFALGTALACTRARWQNPLVPVPANEEAAEESGGSSRL